MAGAAVPRGLIFDLDGTLVDSFADIASALNWTRAQFRLPLLPQAEITRHVGSGSEYLVRQLVPVASERFEEALGFFLARYEKNALKQTRLLQGVPEVLAHFRDRSLAVVTNKTFDLSEKVLRGLGVWDRFTIVVGGDSLERRKPDPLPVRHVLDTFALSPGEVVLIGDSPHDIHAGQAAGVRTVAVTTGVEARAALQALRPDHVIDRMDELLRHYV